MSWASCGSLIAIKREDARYKIALYYVCGFVLIFFYALTIALIRGMKVSDLLAPQIMDDDLADVRTATGGTDRDEHVTHARTHQKSLAS